MVAPNGARLMPRDHSAVPVLLPAILDRAAACRKASADGLHLCDARGEHLLDAGAHREAMAALAGRVPEMPVQVTTGTAGRYRPAARCTLARDLAPPSVSIALRASLQEGEHAEARRLCIDRADAGKAVQHILYKPASLERIAALLPEPPFHVPDPQVPILLRSHSGREGTPADLRGFLVAIARTSLTLDWAICCFGPGETD